MPQRPYWSGQIRISLVSLNVEVYTATKRSSQTPLHEIYRPTGERIHHQNVTESLGKLKENAIVKGFEVAKDEYVYLEEKELQALKLPSSDSLDLENFVDVTDIPTMRFERPYYVLPKGKDAADIYNVLSEVLTESGKAGIGQIALRGREELCALLPYQGGLIIETLRYDPELVDIEDAFSKLKQTKPKAEYLDLAKQLIKQKSGALKFGHFHDHYHEALQELVEAKQHHRKPKAAKAETKSAKVVNFMDALKRSLASKAASKSRSSDRKRKTG